MRPKTEITVNGPIQIIYGPSGSTSTSNAGLSRYYLDWPTSGSSNRPNPVTGMWPVGPYSVHVKTLRYPNGWLHAKGGGGTSRTWSGNVYGGCGINPPQYFDATLSAADLDKLKSAVEIDVLNEVKQSDFNVAVFVAERKSLAAEVISVYRTIVNQLRGLRRNLVKRILRKQRRKNYKRNRSDPSLRQAFNHWAARTSRRQRYKHEREKALLEGEPISSLVERLGLPGTQLWLQYCYSIQPLMGDINGIVDMASGLRRTGLHRVRKSRTAQKTFSNNPVRTSDVGIKYQWSGAATVSETVGASIWVSLELPELAVASSIGLTNPLEVLWEATPYSFLIDGIGLPVGGWLSSMDVGIAHDFHGGSWYVKRESVGQWSVALFQDGGGWTRPEGRIFCDHSNMTFSRSVYLSWPNPKLVFNPPDFSGLVKQFASVMSLAVQAIHGKSTSGLRG